MNIIEYKKYIVKWLKDEVKKTKAKGVVFGISGGVDSALVASIVKKAFPNNHLAIWIDIESSLKARKNAFKIIEDLDLIHKDLDLIASFGALLDQTDIRSNFKDIINDPSYHKLLGNTKSRLRMITLYQYAEINNYLVLGTSNLAEITLGYFTKWGDAAADLYLISNLRKEQIYALAKEFEVNEEIIKQAPSADLYKDQTDEKDMGLTYKDIDAYLMNKEIAPKTLKKILTMHEKAKHKINKNIIQPTENFNL